jgi:hypothetical protein
MKKAMRLAPAFANIASPQVFKSTNSLLYSTYNGYNAFNDD